MSEKRRSTTRGESDRTLGRYEVCDVLGITVLQFTRLQRSPTFPAPVHIGRFSITWSADAVHEFKAKLDYARRRGWKVPDCLYAWAVDFPEPWSVRNERRLKRIREAASR